MSEWLTVPMKSLYLGFWDGPHATPKEVNYGPVFLGIKNITEDGHLDLSNIRHIAEEDYSTWIRRVEPKPGDIVFSYEATLHRYAIIPENFRGCLGRRLALIRTNPSVVNNKFLYYYFFGNNWRKTVSQHMISGSTVDRIPIIEFPNFGVRIPPLPTQRRIAEILSAYDELIEVNTRRIRILEGMAQSVYREWFGQANAESLPEGWDVVTVADFGEVITGKTPSKEIEEYFGSDIPFIKIPDMHGNLFCIHTDDMLSFAGAISQQKKTIPKNSLCVSCIGTAGLVTITTVPAQTNQQINSLIPNNPTEREFLYFSLLGLRETINLYGANGATIVNLNKGKFEALTIVKPPVKLINQFHEISYPMFEQVRVLQLKNANLRRTRDMLLPRLVGGEVAV